jgi:flagellar basal body-associated protein FliL
MRSNNIGKQVTYDESEQEAKNPGAWLLLIMGAYPVMLIVGILIVICFFGVRSMVPSTTRESENVVEELGSPTAPAKSLSERKEVLRE